MASECADLCKKGKGASFVGVFKWGEFRFVGSSATMRGWVLCRVAVLTRAGGWQGREKCVRKLLLLMTLQLSKMGEGFRF